MSPFSMIFILLTKNVTAENQNHKNKKVPFPNAQRRAAERPTLTGAAFGTKGVPDSGGQLLLLVRRANKPTRLLTVEHVDIMICLF